MIHQSERGEKQQRDEERGGASSEHTGLSTLTKSIPSQPENAAAQSSPLLGLLDLNRVFEDVVPGESATQPVKKTEAQNL